MKRSSVKLADESRSVHMERFYLVRSTSKLKASALPAQAGIMFRQLPRYVE
jgi:hypothetical protein